jgi:hypothetical protein
MKILQLEAELLHADGRTDSHEKADSRFSQLCLGTKNRTTTNFTSRS